MAELAVLARPKIRVLTVYSMLCASVRKMSVVATVPPTCRYDSSFPVYLSAVALQKLGHADGELNWSRSHRVHTQPYPLPPRPLPPCPLPSAHSLPPAFPPFPPARQPARPDQPPRTRLPSRAGAHERRALHCEVHLRRTLAHSTAQTANASTRNACARGTQAEAAGGCAGCARRRASACNA